MAHSSGKRRQDEAAKRADDKPKKPPALPSGEGPPSGDDLYEDGDIATPKRDRYGPDDEPI